VVPLEALQAMQEAAKREQELEDRLFAELDTKRARNETVWNPPPGAAPSMLGRLAELGKGALSTTKWILSVMWRFPGAVSSFATKGPSHWRSSIATGWQHFKEEMYHYWVCHSSLPCLFLPSGPREIPFSPGLRPLSLRTSLAPFRSGASFSMSRSGSQPSSYSSSFTGKSSREERRPS
jgi:hypothetical protein